MSQSLDIHSQWMKHALAIAQKGITTSHPNPRVGAVIVNSHGEKISEGFHLKTGEPHAEINALKSAPTQDLSDCIMYVTLEPCCHQGRTGPCSVALIQSGIGTVVVAMRDPNPRVAGRGIEQLQEAGVEVIEGIENLAAKRLNLGFIQRMLNKRPSVRIKQAMSLDARTALHNGESQWITSEAARADGHRWRARSDAIITGVNTVLADDPKLTVRLPASERDTAFHPPIRVVLDTQLKTPATAALFKEVGQIIIFHTNDSGLTDKHKALESAGAVLKVAKTDALGKMSLAHILEVLAEGFDVTECHVEAGATLTGSFIEQGLADEVLIYMAPSLLGQDSAPAFMLPRLDSLTDKTALSLGMVSQIGDDLRILAYPGEI